MPIKLEDIPKIPKGKKFVRVEITQRYSQGEEEFRSVSLAYMTPESLDTPPSVPTSPRITLYNSLEYGYNSKTPTLVDGPKILYLHDIEKITLLEPK